MSVLVRVALFVLALGTVFAAAFGIGRAYDDGGSDAATASREPADEYLLEVLDPPTAAGRGELRFRVEDRDGTTVTDFEVRHEKRLHLIAVDTGYTGYQHLHPTMADDGTWSTPILWAPGSTQVYADFQPADGDAAVAREDLEVPGEPGSSEFDELRTQEVDGYTVTVIGDLAAGGTSDLRFEISRFGIPVDDLEPYLGSYGHLVMLRKADGEYLHVHPEAGGPGPEVAFAASVPSRARYHLYFDFQRDGKVRTAMFVLDASGQGSDDGTGHGDAGHGDH